MDESRQKLLEELVSKLEINIKNWTNFNTALTHPTYVFENKNLQLEHNQRLEFLGDAVLGLIVADFLYVRFSDKPEGELTKMRAGVVCEATLAKIALNFDLGNYLLLGRGEELTGGRQRASILADVFEAIIGAVYLDSGLQEAGKLIVNLLKEEIETIALGNYRDYKTLLQEIVQKDYEENVTYKILKESGPDHNKLFLAGVLLKNKLLAKGTGRSKKEAEQKAARLAIEKLK